MKTFRKYSFSSKRAATTKINALGLDSNKNPTHSHAIVHLGQMLETEGTYDDDNEELTAPVMSSSYHVDVLWNGEPVSSWNSAMVWCAPFGIHNFGSSSANAEWIEVCKELHPEYFPEPSPE